ncbi:unannotated protein [freshwater metagenome]|uniref:Unannotated protein n=1 Tax=freshwater metagenome TaxID=449393 RepID=A0A6J7HE48_9ZZZZ|nr:hypothetical protein [Actinomycetota bacterium]MSZ42161.1 hypothetical protein [Actinomycetota bacterium]
MRVTSRLIAGIGSFALVGVGTFGLATSAHAAASPSTVTLTCVTGSLTWSAPMVSLNSGDTFTFTNSAGGAMQLVLPTGSTLATGSSPLAMGASATITVTASGSIQVAGNGVGQCGFSNEFLALNVSSGGGGGSSPSSSTAPSGPAPVFQQFGKPATGTCADAAAATLNWAGVAGGGWGESWAQWMNGGKGGAVCNRALVYSLGLGKWILG